MPALSSGWRRDQHQLDELRVLPEGVRHLKSLHPRLHRPDHVQLRPGVQPGESWLTAAIPMDSPYCSCKLTRVRAGGRLVHPDRAGLHRPHRVQLRRVGKHQRRDLPACPDRSVPLPAPSGANQNIISARRAHAAFSAAPESRGVEMAHFNPRDSDPCFAFPENAARVVASMLTPPGCRFFRLYGGRQLQL